MYPFTEEQQAQFDNANNTALGCLLTILADQLYDVYMNYTSATALWEALEQKYAEAEADSDGNFFLGWPWLHAKVVVAAAVISGSIRGRMGSAAIIAPSEDS
uniref:Uncharacterized protein n=1 Tax=Oryza punctata TaxID=4537 RepID=A0A0E0LKV8_ORYPU